MENTSSATGTVADSSANPAGSVEELDLALDMASYGGHPSADAMSAEGAGPEDRALVRLHELLRFPSVAVPEGFTDQVMASVQAQEHVSPTRSFSTGSRIVAIVGAVAMLALVAVLGAAAGGAQESVLGGIAQAFASVTLAGAGLLAATWTGVGASVGSWLGTTPTVGAFLALAFVGAALGLVSSLRRSRAGARRSR